MSAPITRFPVMIITGQNGTDWVAINSIEGESHEYNLGGSSTSAGDVISYDFNLTGSKSWWIPGAGTIWADIGWAIDGEGGDDKITGYDMEDWLKGDTGQDSLYGADGRDILEGETGNDKLYGGDDGDYLYGGTENDSLYGDDGADHLDGGAGDDWLNGGAGNDKLVGGVGNDMYRIDSKSTDTIVETADGGTDTIYLSQSGYVLGANLENIITDADIVSSVTLTGNELANAITGAQGADYIYGLAGNDVLNGGSGADQLFGGYGNDSLFGGSGVDKLNGDAGHDYLDGGDGADVMTGGTGNDTYVLDAAGDQAVEAVGAGSDTVQSLLAVTTLAANIENLQMFFAGPGEDYGNALNNVITGSIWSDFIDSAAGNDTIFGSFGNDTAHGGLGNDAVQGDTGNDLTYGDDGDDVVSGGDGSDWVYGGLGNDTAQGDAGNDFVFGDAGNDSVAGWEGNDALYGGIGNDKVNGGYGDDKLYGGMGADMLMGEYGNDRFVFNSTAESSVASYDRIMDFTRGQDKIDLSGIDANTAQSGNQAFNFTGAQPMFGSEGDLFFRSTLIGSVVEGDVNGDGMADFRIVVVGVYDMQASDFIL